MLPYLSALENAIVFKGTVQMSRVYFTFTLLILLNATTSTLTVINQQITD